MNQFLRSFLLLSLFATAGQLTLHATAHQNAIHADQSCIIINKSHIDYSLLIFHKYLNGCYVTLTIKANSFVEVAISDKTLIHAIPDLSCLNDEKYYGIIAENKGEYVIQEGLVLKA
jgi:hypothetical protein